MNNSLSTVSYRFCNSGVVSIGLKLVSGAKNVNIKAKRNVNASSNKKSWKEKQTEEWFNDKGE